MFAIPFVFNLKRAEVKVFQHRTFFFRFNARQSGYLKFRLYVDNQRHLPTSARRLVAFTFHPTDPFAVSVQRTNNAEYIVNFHVRCDNQNPDYNSYDANLYNCM